MKLLIGALLFFSATAVLAKPDLEEIEKDFRIHEFRTDEQAQRKYFFLVGRVVNHQVQLIHFNDIDLTGGAATALGYPSNKDTGRTAGFEFKYILEGSNASVEVNLQNWLFTKPVNPGSSSQYLEEDSTVAIRSRLFRDGNSNQYIIIGMSFTHRVKRPFMLAYIQQVFHSLNGSKDWQNVERRGTENLLHAIIGYGARYDIVKYRHVVFYFTGEAELQGSTKFLTESNFTVRGALNLDALGWPKDIDNPILHIQVFYETSLFIDNIRDEKFGMELFLGLALGHYFIQSGWIIARMHSDLGQEYYGKPQWQTGIIIRVKRIIEDPPIPDYVIK